ncbi:MAG TPA: CHASE2 domain-containing protein [Stellaceae bacterium]|nr:CHASE2 domain-containing protein [Stellaceae bacterium]
MALLALALLIRGFDPAPVRELRLLTSDLAQVASPRAAVPAPVHVVAIDEESLARYGQWPWPRNLLAELVGRIAEGKPRALGIDILFAEPDRLSPDRIGAMLRDAPAAVTDALSRLPSNDRLLADAIAAVPTVLGLAPSNEPAANAAQSPRLTPILRRGADPRPFLPSYPAMLRDLPALGDKAHGSGTIGVVPDRDGVSRRVPLAVAAAGNLVPAFGLEVLRVAAGLRSIAITAGSGGIDRFDLGPLSIPTDDRGRAILHFAPRQARFISAADLLDRSTDPAAVRGAIVLLGVTGLGTVDIKQTPLGPMQGVEIQAQLIESMLFGQLLRRTPGGLLTELVLVLAAGLVPILLLRYQTPAAAAGVTLVLAGGLLAGEFVLLRFANLLADGAYPALTAMAAFAAMLGGHLRAAQIARRRLAAELQRERELKARLDGELAAARSIQMGLLPRRFPIFPDRRDLDLRAHIEPARTVGGDLYDFVLLDRNRLFFLIADVSGKGVPAALFMAMTREVVHDAVVRYGAALDRVLAAANERIAAASADMAQEGGDMMFVTAVVGTLDLATGALAYASAGHDVPFVLTPGARPRQLATDGGPPLGAVDGFIFPIDRDQLDPGAVLLLYTDGVTEAQNADGAFYTVARLASAVGAIPPNSVEAVIEAVLADLHAFVGAAEQADDIALIALQRVPISEP